MTLSYVECMQTNNPAADTASHRAAFATHRGYSWSGIVTPAESYIWERYQEWLTWGPEYLRSIAA